MSYIGITSAVQTALDGKAASLGIDDNYATDAEKTLLGNTSGANTGDSSGHAGLLPLAGGTMSGNLIFGEQKTVKVPFELTADGDYWGITTSGLSGEILVFGDLLYYNNTAWVKADADVQGASRGVLGMCLVAVGSGVSTDILLYGGIRADARFGLSAAPNTCYISPTAGDFDVAAPSTSGQYVRKIGNNIDYYELVFNPESSFSVVP